MIKGDRIVSLYDAFIINDEGIITCGEGKVMNADPFVIRYEGVGITSDIISLYSVYIS